MQDGGSGFADEVVGVGGDLLDVILEDVDDIGKAGGVLDAAFGEGAAVVEAEEQVVFRQADAFEQFGAGPIVDFDGDFLENLGERLGQFIEGTLDETGEFGFADMMGHGYNRASNHSVPGASRHVRGAGFGQVKPGAFVNRGITTEKARVGCHGMQIERGRSWGGVLAAVMLALALSGCGTPSFLITPVQNPTRLQEVAVRAGKGWMPEKVAIIEVEGMLANARAGGFLQPAENPLSLFVEQLDRAASDVKVKAVVLRINSPGGTVTASDTMYQKVVEFRAKTGKPVIASAQEVMASGAYYVACGCDRIVVHPTSVVGSIGVIFNTFDFSGTMAKIGLREQAIKSGPLKDMGSPFQPLTPGARQALQEMVDEYFQRFVGVVISRRKLAEKPVMPLAADDAGIFSGRVFSGERAVALGLADDTGLLEDAIAAARRAGNAPGSAVIMYKRAYGDHSSIYASTAIRAPRSDVLRLELPGAGEALPAGFYYLWRP